MSSDLREHEVREFLARMGEEMPTPFVVPPEAIRRARTRLARTAVAAVLAAVLAIAGVLSGVRSLLRAEPRPADNSREALVAAIPVGGEPVHVGVGEGFVWVAGNSVSKVDPSTNQVVATFPSRSRPEGSAVAVGDGAAWVSGGEFDGEVLRIDAASGEVTTIHPGTGYWDPYAVAIGEGSVWATGDRGGTFLKIDATIGGVETIQLPRVHAYGVTVLDGLVWVVAADVDGDPAELLGVDPASGAVVATLPVGVAHDIMAGFGSLWAPSGSAADAADATILRIDPSTREVVATVAVPFLHSADPVVGSNPPRIAVGEGAVWVAVTDRSDGSTRGRIIRIDPATNEAVGEIAFETAARGIAAGAGAVWVTDGLGTLFRIDPDAVIDSSVPPLPVAEPTTAPEPPEGGPIVAAIPVGGESWEMALGEGDVWVVSQEAGVLVRVDPAVNEVVATIDFGVSDNFASLAVGEGAVWIASAQFADGAIFRIDPGTNEVVATLPDYGDWISAGGGSAWVVGYEGEGPAIIGIDPMTNARAAVVSLGGGPNATAERPAEADGIIWTVVDRATTGDLVGIDPTSGEIVRRFEIDDGRTHGLVAGFGSMWVPTSGGPDGRILRVDPTTGAMLATIEVPSVGRDHGPAVAVGEDAVWVALTDDDRDNPTRGRLLRIDPATNKVVGEIVIGSGAARVAVGEGAVWVTDGLGTLYRIDPTAFDAGNGDES